MIRLTALLRRNPALTTEQFQTYWRDVHAATIVSVPGVRDRIVRYEQHPRTGDAGEGWTGSEGYDGIAVQWYRSREDFDAMLADPGYREVIAPDERELLDLANCVFLLTDEPRVVIDGAVDAASGSG
jgi:hypothetical protein